MAQRERQSRQADIVGGGPFSRGGKQSVASQRVGDNVMQQGRNGGYILSVSPWQFQQKDAIVMEVAATLSGEISKLAQTPGTSSSKVFEQIYELGFERVPAVRTTFEKETGRSWGWLIEEMARIKSDRLKVGVARGARFDSLRWLLDEIHRLGRSHPAARNIFEARVSHRWDWLERQISK